MTFDWPYLITQWPALVDGLWKTIQVSLLGILFSTLIGIVGAGIRQLRIKPLIPIVVGYVELIRNTPILVQLFFIFYGLPSIGISLSLFWSGVLCLSLWAGAYQIENIRGGLVSVEKGMLEAASALNIKPFGYLRLIAIPIAIRSSLPSMLNTSISLLKNSSYLQAIGFAELTFVATDRIATDFRAIEMFAAIGAIYLILVIVISLVVRQMEHRLQAPFRR